MLAQIVDKTANTDNLCKDNNIVNYNNAFLQTINNTNVFFWVMTYPESRICFLNETFERVFNRKREEFYASPYMWKEAILNDDIKIAENAIKEAAKNINSNCIFRILNSEGEIRWIENHIYFQKGEVGEPDFLHGIAFDVTKKVEDESFTENQTAFLASLLDYLPRFSFCQIIKRYIS